MTTTTTTSTTAAASPIPSVDPECNVCKKTTGLLRCSQCQVTFYCGPAHQREQFREHKKRCKNAAKVLPRVAEEERRLRDQPPSMFLPENVFEEGVGSFWLIEPTRPYMTAKLEVIRAMMQLESKTATTLALNEAMDCLRLSRGDNMGVRDVVPSLLLRLGRIQECYDFIKWWATCDPNGTYDWGNMDLPYLDIHGADVTEPIDCFEDGNAWIHHLGALAYIKMAVARGLHAWVKARAANTPPPPLGFNPETGGFVPPDLIDRVGEAGIQAVTDRVSSQAAMSFVQAHTCNLNYWPLILDPTPLTQQTLPSAYARGDLSEIRHWVEPTLLAWYAFPENIAYIEINMKVMMERFQEFQLRQQQQQQQ